MASADVIAHELGGKWEHNQWRCSCPVHGGRSLMVRDKDGRPVVNCFGGCEFRDVARALEDMGLWDKKPKPKGPPRKKVEWAQWVVPIYEAAKRNGERLNAQDHADYRKAKAVLNEAREVGNAA